MATGCILSGLTLFASQTGANLYEWPPGVKADFRVCKASPDIPRQLDACRTLGFLECDGQLTGNAFLVRAEGDREIIVSSAHAFINKETNQFYKNCVYFLQGGSSGVNLTRAALSNRSVYKSDGAWDIAAAQLERSVKEVTWRIPLQIVSQNDLEELVTNPSVRFSFIALHPWERVAVVSAYPCAPVPKKAGHRQFHIRTKMNHNCPAISGFSGSPGMMWNAETSGYAVFCIFSSSLGAEDRRPFDPTLNPNTCAVITPEFVDLVNRLSRNESVEAPEGGAVIDFKNASPD